MNMRRGMSAIKSVIDDNKRNQQSGGFMRFFKLEDGETTTVIFMDPTEPAYVKEHNFKNRGSFKAIQHRDENCVPCHLSSGGDRRIGRASDKACFSLYDLSWKKKVKDEKKSAEAGQERFNYLAVEEEDVTPKGIAKGVFVRGGKCGWKMSTQWMQAISAVNASAGKRCRNCGGKIKRIGYEKKDGTKFLASKFEDHQVEGFLSAGKIVERLECDRCDEPLRKSIFNSIVQITRAGKDTNTTYQFELVPDDIPDDVVSLLDRDNKEGVHPYDWEAMFPEPSPEAQAADLGVKNPFGGSGKSSSKGAASSYDEDDEDEDEDDDDYTEDPFAEDSDDEDDEDEKPKKKKVVTKVATKKKRIVEEADDDDDDDERPAAKKKVVVKKGPTKVIKLKQKTPVKVVTKKLKFGSK